MFNAANQTHFSLSIEGLAHDLQVLEFKGREAISQPFEFELELISERPDLDLESLLHQAAFLALDQTGNGIHGQIYRIAQGESQVDRRGHVDELGGERDGQPQVARGEVKTRLLPLAQHP